MYGWRGRVGLIVPASNTTCECEMQRLSPRGVAIAATRVMFESTLAGLARMIENVERATDELTCEQVSDVIVFCCTVGSMLEGAGYDQKIIGMLQERGKTVATTTTTAVVAALQYLSAERIAVVTPYTLEINAVEKRGLESLGFEVTRIDSFNRHIAPGDFRNTIVAQSSASDIYRLAREVDSADADVLFLSCTNLPAIDMIDCLERDCGKPVITSNQAAMWHALQLLQIAEPINGFGRLLGFPERRTVAFGAN